MYSPHIQCKTPSWATAKAWISWSAFCSWCQAAAKKKRSGFLMPLWRNTRSTHHLWTGSLDFIRKDSRWLLSTNMFSLCYLRKYCQIYKLTSMMRWFWRNYGSLNGSKRVSSTVFHLGCVCVSGIIFSHMGLASWSWHHWPSWNSRNQSS